MSYQPQHPDEGIVVVDRSTKVAVAELPGGFGNWDLLAAILNHDRYFLQYTGEWLGNLNKVNH